MVQGSRLFRVWGLGVCKVQSFKLFWVYGFIKSQASTADLLQPVVLGSGKWVWTNPKPLKP